MAFFGIKTIYINRETAEKIKLAEAKANEAGYDFHLSEYIRKAIEGYEDGKKDH